MLVNCLLAGNHISSRSVTDTGRITRSNDAILLKHRRKLGERLDGCLGARVFIHLENFGRLLHLNFNGSNLIFESAIFMGLSPALLRSKRKFITLLTRNTVLFREVLCGNTHRGRDWNLVHKRDSQAVDELKVNTIASVTETHTVQRVWGHAHVLGTSCEYDV